MNFQRETLFDVIEEVQPLLELHYNELTLNKECIRLQPRWDVYTELERLGLFVLFTAREGVPLAGYNAFFLQSHMHYASLKTAQNDVLFMHPAYRRGTTALRFLDYCEQQLTEMGAGKIGYHIKFSLDWRPILHRRGYCDEEVMCAKLLQGS